MALVELLFGSPVGVKIGENASEENATGVITLDAAVTQTHTMASKVTEHPVESGVDISDHVLDQPDRLSIQGVFTNTPIVFLAAITENPKRAEDAFESLEKIKKEGTRVEVVTSLKSYKNMILTGMTATRTAKVGDAIEVSLDFQEIRTAEVENRELTESTTPGPKNLGKKAKTTAKASNAAAAETKASSWLFGGLTGLFGG